MYIKKLYILNLEELYKACCLKQDSATRDSKFTFKNNLINLYNHVELTFLLNDVSIYEYILLKRFSSTCSKLNNKNILYKSPDYTNEIHEYAKLIYDISIDKDIVNTPIKYNYPYMYGPSYLVRGDCAITLTGRELIHIFDIDPSTLFISATKGKCLKEPNSILFDKDFNLSNIENHAMLVSYIEERFIKVFYNNFFISSTTNSDLITDSAIHYYCTIHDSLIKLSSVSNPIFKYNIGRESLKEKTNFINGIKKESDKILLQYIDKKSIIDNTYVTFNIYSRFSTYIDLFENLPKEFFISYEDLKIPANFKEIYIPIEFHNKYAERLEDVYTNLNTYIEHEHKNFYVKYQCTYLNSMYAYSIRIKLDDVNKYINTIDYIKLLPETKEVIDNIIKYSRAVVKMF